MKVDVKIAGASYNEVPSVLLPLTAGGKARFCEVSDTTAETGDVAKGKKFYTADGELAEGTLQATQISVSETNVFYYWDSGTKNIWKIPLTVSGNTYELYTYDSANKNATIDFDFSADNLALFIGYHDNVTLASLSEGGELYNFFKSHDLVAEIVKDSQLTADVSCRISKADISVYAYPAFTLVYFPYSKFSNAASLKNNKNNVIRFRFV
ncbi:hypothetical protein DW949_13445 [Megasphaera sp. AM44-1BH]|uniref:hypothetical protein n=1 Tax=Megasphaera sp. AM44-1BH TaxID=2292358 RepID=UPI000E4AE502|nr:hypothetical protein [Megasphaera sp. AM44-1BH]RHA07760.1 hypothetical protein DW949_13445 [Megasphaera sp. AM44-1BH]